MKRILFTMMLMVATLVTWAQRWNPVSNNSYSGESPVYLRITLNGNEVSPNDGLEVAAFMDTGNGLQQLTFMNRHSKVTYPMTYSY